MLLLLVLALLVLFHPNSFVDSGKGTRTEPLLECVSRYNLDPLLLLILVVLGETHCMVFCCPERIVLCCLLVLQYL